MSDIAAVTQALGAIKHATDIVRVLRSAETLYETAELKLKIAELAGSLADARLAVLDAQAEIQTLREQLARASEKDRSTPLKKGGVYYFGEGEGASGPFCPRCFEADGRRMPLTSFSGPFKAAGTYNCPQCQAIY